MALLTLCKRWVLWKFGDDLCQKHNKQEHASQEGLEGFGEGHEKPAPLGMTMVPGQLGK